MRAQPHGPTLVSLLASALFGCDHGPDPDRTKAPLAAIEESAPIGTLEGAPGVSADGAATYSVPLAVPPGRAGMQPSLALNYSSRGGAGSLGVGWSVSAGSQISRCGSDLRRDGEVRPVQLNVHDHYCLDGMRLVPTPDGDYRTEPDTAARIRALASDDVGVLTWVVEARDGTITTYGDAPESRVEADFPTITSDTSTTLTAHRFTWLQSRVEDRAGNYRSYAYNRSPAAGTPTTELEWSLAAIEYTGFRDGAAPNRRIAFEYDDLEDERDQRESFFRGVRIRTTRRLAAIAMTESASTGSPALVRRYELEYHRSDRTGRSLLGSVTACDRFGACLPPTRFSYHGAAPSFALVNDDTVHLRDGLAGKMVFTLDVDGDGRDDLVYRDASGSATPSTDRFAVRRSDGTRLGPEVTSTHPDLGASGSGAITAVSAYDVDRDGRTDLVARRDDHYCDGPCVPDAEEFLLRRTWEVSLANGSGFGAPAPLPGFPATGSDEGDLFADASFKSHGDGDGDLRPDAFYLQTSILAGDSKGWLMNGMVPLQDSPSWRALDRCGGGAAECSNVHAELGKVLDVDGDGASDLLLPYVTFQGGNNTGTLGYDLLHVRGGGTVEAVRTNLESSFDYYNGQFRPLDTACSVFADVNGDGLLDQVSVKDGLSLRLNLGAGQFSAWLPGLHASSPAPFTGLPTCADPDKDAGVRVVDYDQDGRADLLLLGKTGPDSEPARALISRGRSFVVEEIPSLPLLSPAGDAWASRTFDLDGDGLFDVVQSDGTTLEVWRQVGGPDRHADKLSAVENGFGAAVWAPVYAPLLETGYVKPSGCVYPETCYTGSMLVVREERIASARSSAAAPASGASTYVARRHAYAGGRVDSRGDGWLGFATHTVATLLPTGAVWRTTRTTYDQQARVVAGALRYPHKQSPVETLTWVPLSGGVVRATRQVMTYATRELAAATRYFPYLATLVESEYEAATFSPDDPDATAPLRRTTTSRQVDDFGNETLVTIDRGAAVTTTTNRSPTVAPITNDTDLWLIGLVNREEVTSARGGEATTRTTRLVYESDGTGRVRDVIREPDGDPGVRLCTRVVSRDPFGSPARVEVTPNGCATTSQTRTVDTTYDGDGTFVASTTNALDHEVSRTTDPGLGVVTSETDPSGLVTSHRFDGFGRPVGTTQPDGASTTTTYAACGGFALCVTTTGNDGARTADHFDRLGQKVQTAQRTAFEDTFVDHGYDELGQLAEVSRPYHAGEPRYLESLSYDAAGRLTSSCRPACTATECDTSSATPVCRYLVYQGLTTSEYDYRSGGPTGVDGKRTTRRDGAGLIEATTIYPDSSDPDSTGLTTSFEYGPFDVLRRVLDPTGGVVELHYDVLGRQTVVDDKNLGRRTIAYTAFDEVETETDATGRQTTTTYDRAGRIQTRTAGGDPDTDTFTWDPDGGAGRLASHERGTIKNELTYDDDGRTIKERWTIDGEVFDYDYTYDDQGRLVVLHYPEVPGAARVAVRHTYAPAGRLWTVDDVTNPADARTVWTADDVDAAGNVTAETLGNGVATTRTYFAETGRARRITAAVPQVTLSVAKLGTGTVVESASGRIDCGATCSASYAKHSTVALQASAGAGYQLAGWEGCASASGATCTVVADAAKTVTASFTPATTPPAKPAITARSSTAKVTVRWPGVESATGYDVLRNTTGSLTSYSLIASNVSCGAAALTCTAGEVVFTNTGLTNNVTYYYAVRARNAYGVSERSNQASAKPIAAPSTSFKATSGNGRIDLSWTAVSGATQYRIYSRDASYTGGGGVPDNPAYQWQWSSTVPSSVDWVANGRPLCYVVRAVNATGESVNSIERCTTAGTPAVMATAGDERVTLTWPETTGATSYLVKRGTTSGSWPTTVSCTITGTTTRTCVDTAVTPFTNYYYVVTATYDAVSLTSTQVHAQPYSRPRAPSFLLAFPEPGRIHLYWEAVPGATYYRIHSGTSPSTSATSYQWTWTVAVADPATTGSIDWADWGPIYYVVTAGNAYGESATSSPQATATGWKNLARGRPANQSTDYSSTFGRAAAAVDGDTNASWPSGSVSSTSWGNGGSPQWWRVDLGASKQVYTIDVFNRLDCCSEVLANFDVYVSTQSTTNPTSWTLVANHAAQAGSPSTIVLGSWATGGRIARHVKIQLRAPDLAVMLAEVQVWGH